MKEGMLSKSKAQIEEAQIEEALANGDDYG